MEFDLKHDVNSCKFYLTQLHDRRGILEESLRKAKPASMLAQAVLRELDGVNEAISYLLQSDAVSSGESND